MNYEYLPNGDLELTANNEDRTELAEQIQQYGWSAAEGIIHDNLFCNCGFSFVLPEDIGALTDAPIITDGEQVWWFPNYMVADPWLDLRMGRVVFSKAN